MDHSHANDSIILVVCCRRKLTEPAPAADLYVSPLFKKARTYSERRGRWFILSALHGLLDPTEVIAPFDVTLKKMLAQKRREWGQKVRQQRETAGLIGLRLVALAGADSVKPLTDAGRLLQAKLEALHEVHPAPLVGSDDGRSLGQEGRDGRAREEV